MSRRRRDRESDTLLNLDSLMDILSCLVGVMLFLVMYTVLELGSTSFEVTVPSPRDRPVDSRRVIVIASAGTVRVMDTGRPVSDLLTGAEAVEMQDVGAFVRQANLSPPTDSYFQYLLHFDEEAAVLQGRAQAYEVEIRELPGERGDSLSTPDAPSEYAALLDDLDPDDVWLEFFVDAASVGVFRRARGVAEERGFATRWSPLALDFPVTYDLAQDRDGPRPRGTYSKPQR